MNSLYNLLSECLSRFMKNGTLAFVMMAVACSFVHDYALKNDYRYVIFWSFVVVVCLSVSLFQKISVGRWDNAFRQLRSQERLLKSFELSKELFAERSGLLNRLNALIFDLEERRAPRYKLLGLIGLGGAVMASGVISFYVALYSEGVSLWWPFCLLTFGALSIAGISIAAIFVPDPRMADILPKSQGLSADVAAFKQKVVGDGDNTKETRRPGRPSREADPCAIQAKSEDDGHAPESQKT